MAPGEFVRSFVFQYRLIHSCISVVIKQVAEAIIRRVFKLIMINPTDEELRKIRSSFFFSKWNYPEIIGSIDEKHISIKAQKCSGSLYINNIEYYAIFLQGAVDADSKCIVLYVGSYGRERDAVIYLKSKIGLIIKTNTFKIPAPKALLGTDNVVTQ